MTPSKLATDPTTIAALPDGATISPPDSMRSEYFLVYRGLAEPFSVILGRMTDTGCTAAESMAESVKQMKSFVEIVTRRAA